MKYAIIAAFIALSFSSHGQGEISRQYDFVQDVDVLYDDVVVEFFKNDRVVLNIQVIRDGSPINLTSNNAFYLWEMMNRTNRESIVYTSVGTASTNGMIQFVIPSADSGIDSGLYLGYISLSIGSSYLTEEFCVAQRHVVSIRDVYN